MKKVHILAAAAALAVPAAFAQAPMYPDAASTTVAEPAVTTYSERITVYEHPRYQAFVAREGGALQSGGVSIEDTMLADDVAMALAEDRRLRGATVTVAAHNGRVSLAGSANQEQSERARQIAQRVAGVGKVSGELANTSG